ncbi:hypothetical protein BGZ49_000878 [Haplosporangium sp. Z 27]|nr:hypothetical protein BGZ49_000878 [Haplosporangium sp. Z 27]
MDMQSQISPSFRRSKTLYRLGAKVVTFKSTKLEQQAYLDLPMILSTRRILTDGAWFFEDTRYAGSLAIKLYTQLISEKKHDENNTSSDIRSSFLKTDGVSENTQLKKYRKKFVDSNVPESIKGILRIHIEIPSSSGTDAITHVRHSGGNEDVMVYINESNLDDFFYCGISENKDDMILLKKMIKYIISK